MVLHCLAVPRVVRAARRHWRCAGEAASFVRGCAHQRGPAEGAALEAWLLGSGAAGLADGAVKMSWDPGIGGLAPLAARKIYKGEVLAAVPRELVLEVPLAAEEPSEDALPLAVAAGGYSGAWYDVLGSAQGRASVAALSVRLLSERAAGAASPFAAYCASLPPPQELPSLLHALTPEPWPEELLAASPLLARLYEEAVSCNLLVLELIGQLLPGTSSELQRWALAAVVTRNFELREPWAIGLLPLLDLFNHCSPSMHVRPSWACSYQKRGDSLVMVADRVVAPGELLTFVYASVPDAELLVQYGIPPSAPGENNSNVAGLPVTAAALGPPGALMGARSEVLRGQGWVDQTKPLLFVVPTDLQPGGALLALARLLALDSAEEVESLGPSFFSSASKANVRARRKPGGRPAVAGRRNPQHELRSWSLLADWLQAASSTAECMGAACLRPGNVGNSDLAGAVAAIAAGEAWVLQEALFEMEQRALAAKLLVDYDGAHL